MGTLFALASCADAPVAPEPKVDDQPRGPAPGVYVLASVSGRPLPYTLFVGSSGSTTLLADTLVLAADSSAKQSWRVREVRQFGGLSPATETIVSSVRTGTYHRASAPGATVELRNTLLNEPNSSSRGGVVLGDATAEGARFFAGSRWESNFGLGPWEYRKVSTAP